MKKSCLVAVITVLAAVAGAKEQLARWRSWLRPSAANEAAFYGGSFTGLPLELQEELLALTDALLAEGFIGSDRQQQPASVR